MTIRNMMLVVALVVLAVGAGTADSWTSGDTTWTIKHIAGPAYPGQGQYILDVERVFVNFSEMDCIRLVERDITQLMRIYYVKTFTDLVGKRMRLPARSVTEQDVRDWIGQHYSATMDEQNTPIQISPDKLGVLETLPGSNTLAGQVDPAAVVLEYGPSTTRPAVPGRMMVPVYDHARRYPMQPQVFTEQTYLFPKLPAGKKWMMAPTTEWSIVDPKGSVVYDGWVLVLSGGRDIKVEGNHFACEGGEGPATVVLYNVNDPWLCWVDTAWFTVKKN